ncbi:hypothetical protein MSS4_00388 [Mycobacterium marinum]|nr:hypothetical protein MSS4_00388 [Mycobacterium marinum]
MAGTYRKRNPEDFEELRLQNIYGTAKSIAIQSRVTVSILVAVRSRLPPIRLRPDNRSSRRFGCFAGLFARHAGGERPSPAASAKKPRIHWL